MRSSKLENDGFIFNRKSRKDGLYEYVDPDHKDPAKFIDDDIFGYMKTESKGENGEKGSCSKRKSPLCIGRAVSINPWNYEVVFNSTPGAEEYPIPYSSEVHYTQYQWSGCLALKDVLKNDHIEQILDILVNIPMVGGKHSSSFYDFVIESIVLRVTDRHVGGIQNCFNYDGNTINIGKVISGLLSEDIASGEIVVGGKISSLEDLKNEQLKNKIFIFPGVNKAVSKVKEMIK